MKYRKFRIELIVGMIVVALLGWLLHYVYRWTGNAFLVGLFVPVNESVWEHMKLVYVPMLILSVVMMTRWGEETSACNSSIPDRNICGNLAYSSLILHLQGNCW